MSKTPKIYFFLEEIEYRIKDKKEIRSWIIKAADNEEHSVGEINYILTNDQVLLQLNKEYLRHHTLTDIITFDLSDKKGELTGDIYISIDRARENAKEYRVSICNELQRLMIHGVLHLMGYKDKTSAEKEIMREKEEFYLSLLP